MPKVWYFPFTKLYWVGNINKKKYFSIKLTTGYNKMDDHPVVRIKIIFSV